MLKAADSSAHWLSWLFAFSVLGVVNSLAGGIAAKVVPNVHALESVNFGSVVGTLLFLNMALVAASFFLAAICGTSQSTALTVFLIMGMIVASSTPAMGAAASMAYSFVYDPARLSLDTYNHPDGTGGAFWAYSSTERQYEFGEYDPETGTYPTSMKQCELPLVSYEQGRNYKTTDERNEVPKEDIFQGCYVVAAATSGQTATSSFFWYFIPQNHFAAAWSNILGYTSLPGNTFSFAKASQSPEELAKESLSNFKGNPDPLYDPDNTDGTKLFSQGSTIVTERFYSYDLYYDDTSTCPGTGVVPDLCSGSSSECSSPKLGSPTTGGASVNDTIGLLASLVLIYSLLAGYTVAVLPMGNGAALKFYFPFLPKYWCGGRGSDKGGNEQEGGVEAVGVSKSYGQMQALKPFSLTMKTGEVTALLGHNGAGKSTFVNVLCCEQNPTGGDIRVQGHSITSDQDKISKMIGECKQDDILWPNLTAREHLELFGGIRGVSSDEMAATVQKWLDSVDLDSVQHVRVGTFSGGMKRRLSVALATIGDASVVVLDEPTTGMDPVSRRFVWQHISEIKAGRVILLTTHAMEEADLLSDHVAIMCQGKLEAYGSPLELKTKHGSALQINLIYEKEEAEAVKEAVQSTFADSLSYIEFDASESGYSTLTIKKVYKEHGGSHEVVPAVAVPVTKSSNIPHVNADVLPAGGSLDVEGVSVSSLSNFIGWLESGSSPVTEFGISNSSLEEVFLAVTRHASPTSQQLNERRGCCCCCRPRRPKTSAETDNIESSNVLPTPTQNMNQLPKVDISTFSRKISTMKQTRAIVRFFFARNWTGRPSIVNWTIFTIFCLVNMIIGFVMATMWPSFEVQYYLLITVCLLSFMLISVISPIYSDRNNGLFKMMSTQSMSETSFLLGTTIYSLIVQFTYVFVLLTLFFGSTVFRNASTPDCGSTTYNDDLYGSSYTSYDNECGYATFGEKPVIHPSSRVEVFSGIYEGSDATVYAYPSAGGYEMIFGIIVVFSLSFPGSVLSSAFLPGFKITLVCIGIALLAACVSPGILHLTYAIDPYSYGNCIERIAQHFEFDMFESSGYTLDDVSSTFVEDVGLSQMNPFVFCTPAYAGILPQMGLFQTLALTLMSDITFYSEPEGYVDQFVAKLNEGGATCRGNTCNFEYARQLYSKNLGYMMLGACLLLVLGFLMATFLLYPLPCMVRARHAVTKLFKCCGRRHNDSTNTEDIEEMNEVDVERKKVHAIMQPVLVRSVDIEANNSPAPILSYSARNDYQDQLPPVVMHKLQKVFPSFGGAPPKVALRSLDLHVPKGEVLGLLGKNGAGKTTALKILAGMHEASSGIGLISGFNVETERNAVYERLGNCPQFDCVWKDQSVQRHLEFYARLKGIDNPTQAAFDIADAVGLGAPEVYMRPSGNLSGGMRRRLSIAISLIGSPNTLLLDEPTTGLDPSTRNEIWSLVSSFATPERAIIITTHMMLEADALCQRIAIVAKGALKVVGTQQHLKDKYGSGYLLQLNLTHDNEESINSLLQFVKANIHEDAKIATKQAKTIHINLPRDANIQKIFTTLYSDSAAEAMINQFLVSQSSLEDVFLALGE